MTSATELPGWVLVDTVQIDALRTRLVYLIGGRRVTATVSEGFPVSEQTVATVGKHLLSVSWTPPPRPGL